jgi:integrase
LTSPAIAVVLPTTVDAVGLAHVLETPQLAAASAAFVVLPTVLATSLEVAEVSLEILELLAAIDADRTFLAFAGEDRLAPLWVLAASSGMRRGELLGVRWSDVDLDAATLQVRSSRVAFGALQVTKEPKTTRSRRTIPLPDRTVEALRTWKARQARERLAAGSAYTDLGLVFADELGGYLSPSGTSKAFGRQVKAAGLPRITLHQVRHSFATIALEQGIDVLYVSELLGHSSAAITQTVYQHSRPERVRAAVDTISKAIEG